MFDMLLSNLSHDRGHMLKNLRLKLVGSRADKTESFEKVQVSAAATENGRAKVQF